MVSNRTRPPLQGGIVVSLRPVGAHDALRRAAAAQGARVLALSPWRIALRDDAATRKTLREALAADAVVFTSPNAVRAAANLLPLRKRKGAEWLAVGAGTASALRRAGIANVASPARMDSEGLLSLPALRDVRGKRVGLVTAPGGRGVIATALARRGARITRADVYERITIAPSPRALATLRALRTRPWLALSSGEALQHVLTALPADAARRLRTSRVLAASERLAELARELGFDNIHVATDARPRALLDAATH